MVDTERRFNEREADELIALGYELVDVTQLQDTQRMLMICRTPRPSLLDELRTIREEW